MVIFILQSSLEKVPMTSQFDPKMFTLAAFDNFNHKEATLSQHCNSKHYFNGNHKEHLANLTFQQQLKFQDLLPYIKPVKKPDLPPGYCVKEELFDVSTEKASKLPEHGCYGDCK